MSIFFGNGLNRIIRAPENEGGGGGGAPTPVAPDLAALTKQNADLLARLEALEKKGNPTPPPPAPKDPPNDDLAAKAAKEREEKEKKAGETKTLQTALKFNMTIEDFNKTNAALLPKTFEGILAQAEKEVYGSEIEKAQAIKVGLVSEFFAVQANLDLLTESQKNALAEFKLLTKTDKQDRVSNIYETIFEPTFEALKRERKAAQVSKGLGDPSTVQNAYLERVKGQSKKHYFKER